MLTQIDHWIDTIMLFIAQLPCSFTINYDNTILSSLEDRMTCMHEHNKLDGVGPLDNKPTSFTAVSDKYPKKNIHGTFDMSHVTCDM